MPDEYWDLIVKHADGIINLYLTFEDKKPVLLFDIQDQKVYAYPYEDYKNDLSKKSQGILKKQYEEATKNDEFVIFVRDNVKKKLISFSLCLPDGG